MSLDLRVRAAIATLDVFGFNPHQRRGPDGRFIKMGDHELKRPRRPRKPRGVADSRAAWRAARDEYNESVLDYAERQVEPLAKQGHDASSLADKIDNIRFLKGDPEYDIEIDELRGTLVNYYGHDAELPNPPAPPGVKMVERAENPLYRTRREQYNVDVMQHVASDKVIMQDEDRYPELYALHARAESMAEGPERDAVIDQMVDILNQRKTADYPYRPPTAGGPQYAEAVGGGQRPGFDAPYDQRQAALRASVDTGAYGEEMLAQGAMGETRRFELADGTSAVYKRHVRDFDRGWNRPVWTKKDQTDAEELGAMTAAALGVRAPAVTRTSDDEIYMELMPGKIGELRWPGRATPPKWVVESRQGIRMGLLDVLIGNTDRHGGNYLVDEDENLYAIDHGMAFNRTHRIGESGQVEREPSSRPMVSGDFALQNFVSPSGNYYNNPLTPSDIDHARRQINALRPEFEARGRGDWWLSMSERLDLLGLRADGTDPIY